jgi:RNA-binding protein
VNDPRPIDVREEASEPPADRLTGKQRRYLRSLGHHLDAVVQLGKHGITDAVIEATGSALDQHELIKIRRGSECPATRGEIALALSGALAAEVVQQLGHTLLLYRRHPKEPTIRLP